MRFFIDLSYCGTKFNGWQQQKNQKNSRCVQDVLESSIFTLTRHKHEIVGCGRTDAGVHARHYIAHLDSELQLTDLKFIKKLNQILPEDIAVHSIYRVPEDAHARFDAISRTYSYSLHWEKSPFPLLSFEYKIGKPDLDKLQAASNLLLPFEDFNTFCKSHSDVKTTKCHITAAAWYEVTPTNLIFRITADRFLRGMVRMIVGMCLDVSRGRLSAEQVIQCLENRERLPRHWSVPAIGLILEDICYPNHIIALDQRLKNIL